MIKTLTDKQRETVDYWFAFCNARNRWPSIAEYCREVKMARSTAIGRLKGAANKGVMDENPFIIKPIMMRALGEEREQLKNQS